MMGVVEPAYDGRPRDFKDIGLSRQGSVVSVDQVLEWAVLGRTFRCQQGDAGTRVAWVVTAYDENRPQFAITVPAGRVLIPLSLDITVEIQAGTFTHHIWSTTTNDIGTGTSTDLPVTNMRQDAPFATGVTAQGIYSADAVTATGLVELKRWVDPFVFAAAGAPRNLNWDIKNNSVVPIIVGPGTLQMHSFATTSDAEGYVEAVWAEFTTRDLIDKVS